jgi:hypothetical protein
MGLARCEFTSTASIVYSGTCTSPSYPTSNLRVTLAAAQTLIIVTTSDGLM